MSEEEKQYIGAPNGVVVCLDQQTSQVRTGRLYQRYSDTPTSFVSYDQLVFQMENFFDEINFPHQTNTVRSFVEKTPFYENRQERMKCMTDEELLSQHGDLGTFIIRVQHRQNSSWQGRITWTEQNKTVSFRSIWEMIKLIESAVDESRPEECEARVEPTWYSENENAQPL